MSVGVATYRAHVNTSLPAADQKNAILKKADSALYAAKLKGKNCVVAAESSSSKGTSNGVILKT